MRELREELGVEVEVFALLAVVDDLEERSGRLYRHFVYVVERWRGDVRAAEGQDVFWLEPSRAGDVGPWNPIARWTLSLLSREALDLLVQRTRAGRADAGDESARGKAP